MEKKPSQSPTARWVFLCFSSIHKLSVDDAPALIINLQGAQQTIIEALGEHYRSIYS